MSFDSFALDCKKKGKHYTCKAEDLDRGYGKFHKIANVKRIEGKRVNTVVDEKGLYFDNEDGDPVTIQVFNDGKGKKVEVK